MKKTFLLLMVIVALAGVARSQSEKITGSWMLKEIVVNNEVSNPYQIMEYRDDGKVLVMGIEFGTWKYNGNDNTIVMKSQIDKDFNKTLRVDQIDDKTLITKNDNEEYHYSRIDPEAIVGGNENSGLEGLWKVQSDDGVTKYLKFVLPDDYTYIEVTPESTETASGTWIFNPDENSMIIIGFTQMLRGECTIEKHTDSELIFKNKGNTLNAVKVNPGESSLEKLDFDYDEIEAADEERQDRGENDLPWPDFDQMTDYLGNVEYLTYRVGELIHEVGVMTYTNAYASKVDVNADEQVVEFTDFDVSRGDTMQISQNVKGGLMERYNDFFPKEEPWPYRVAGKNVKVEVPAGTFVCTVIEGFDGDDKVKYWMINDKPGVYAKTVKVGDSFGEMRYTVTELTGIIRK
jgi:hypothetical protein